MPILHFLIGSAFSAENAECLKKTNIPKDMGRIVRVL